MSDIEINRRVIYADVNPVAMTTNAMSDPPDALWGIFQTAGEQLRAKDRALAIQELKRIANDPNSPTAARLLAWKWLNDLGVPPPPAPPVALLAESKGSLHALYADGSASRVLGKAPIERVSAAALWATVPVSTTMSQIAGCPPSVDAGIRLSLLSPGRIDSQVVQEAMPGDLSDLLDVARQIPKLFSNAV